MASEALHKDGLVTILEIDFSLCNSPMKGHNYRGSLTGSTGISPWAKAIFIIYQRHP